MEGLKRHWFNIPIAIRKPIILVVGMLFVIASALTGWLPGPGGLPLFFIGIAILATEFAWARRLRDWVVAWVHRAGQWYHRHKFIGMVIILTCVAIAVSGSILAYRTLHS